ncbi:metallophosphoesterase [Streptomyces sp. Li-HN-5-11]|uniref:metallophosphoesterase n=1 Tax=Streptomyces sp. Li-HN-5-11 TaxID=3075432 RepID=UPI0028A5DD0A|nr:metallophosphoesterase [Streptomyces sp. Li-HN-5-11]WNM29773.1 metallophosphoesterase [Streptomyces sp. Li-HN-5-11]
MVVVVVLVALVVLAAVVAANWYLWRRLFRDTTRGPGTARRAGAALIACGWALAVGALVAEPAGAPFWLQRTLAWPGFLWLALSVYLLPAVLAGEAVRPVLRRLADRRTRATTRPDPAAPVTSRPAPAPATVAGAPAPTKPHGQAPAEPSAAPPATPPATPPAPPAAPTRRLFVSRVVGGTAAAAAVGTVGYGTYGVLRGPSVKRVTVPLAKLPRAADGFRIAVVSDIHLGPILGRGFAQKVVDTINATQPDLIAVVGDLVDGSVKDLGPAAAPLAQLRARHGAYFVTGNHEYFSGAQQWVAEVRRLGLHPLENARTELPGFDLAGVNDLQGESEGQGPDFGRALGDRDTTRACVLLAHQPVQIHEAVRHGVDLQLSGHTHGGQLWPGNLIAAAANPTVAGLERYGDTQLYVSRGAGAWGPPTRVGAPSDITVVRLASKQA